LRIDGKHRLVLRVGLFCGVRRHRKLHGHALLEQRRHDHHDDEQHQHHVDERCDVDVGLDTAATTHVH
jgi:hypothetical protein